MNNESLFSEPSLIIFTKSTNNSDQVCMYYILFNTLLHSVCMYSGGGELSPADFVYLPIDKEMISL